MESKVFRNDGMNETKKSVSHKCADWKIETEYSSESFITKMDGVEMNKFNCFGTITSVKPSKNGRYLLVLYEETVPKETKLGAIVVDCINEQTSTIVQGMYDEIKWVKNHVYVKNSENVNIFRIHYQFYDDDTPSLLLMSIFSVNTKIFSSLLLSDEDLEKMIGNK